MSPSITTLQTLEQALTELPAKLRVHEVAKRAGLTSKEVLAALSAAGVKASSAASSVTADDAVAVLTTLLTPQVTASTEDPAADRPSDEPQVGPDEADGQHPGFASAPLFLPPAPATPARRRRGAKAAVDPAPDGQLTLPSPAPEDALVASTDSTSGSDGAESAASADGADQLDAAAETGTSRSGRRRRGRSGSRGRSGQPEDSAAESAAPTDPPAAEPLAGHHADEPIVPSADGEQAVGSDLDDDEDGDQARRRRRRGRRGRGRVGDDRADEAAESVDESAAEPAGTAVGEDVPAATEDDPDDESGDDETNEDGSTRRRRRRRRRSGSAEPVSEDGKGEDDPDNTVVHLREPRPARESTSPSSDVQGIRGSTRLEAKRQRRRDTRGTRSRPQILTEAEFLARREAVDRVMAVRQRGDLAQVALLEDGILVEHFVSLAGSESLMGNIYLGKVQNVLPSMEAAFVDIGKGRNAVLYAGEVNWDAAGLAGKARRIETALSGGDTILVQVSKDPVGQKGARLTTQISLPGRFLVYVPGGGATGISRKLPDTERKRLKSILDRIVPEDAGVIIRTAAEGVAEEELARDVDRLKSQWEAISDQAKKKGNAPLQLSAEPDTLIKVIRDLFNSDISSLVLDGDRAYEPVAAYVQAVAPELANRVSKYDGPGDVFTAYRIDEQIAKALERKVYLPSGGSLVIDRTEAMTVVDVNTGKYTGSGGNLEETVTRNNLEAAEEVVRQLRLRDIGGIIVVDFIDMVLESNRELVMRRLTECLGRDRTRHQVAEVTSLGLIQMTRKKMGTGLVEAFSEPCPHCQGRGILLHDVPMEDRSAVHEEDNGKSRRRGKGRQESAPEPEPIAKLVPATVRPPDPRGPKPPTRNGDVAHDAGPFETAPSASVSARSVSSAPAPSAPVSSGSVSSRVAETGSNASFNAPRSRDASDAVSAVLAALDAQATRKAEASPGDGAAADVDVAPVEAAPSGGRRRGRRAAGRPAGAPTSAASAEPVAVTEAEPVAVTEDLAPAELVPTGAGVDDVAGDTVAADTVAVDTVAGDTVPVDEQAADAAVVDPELVGSEVASEVSGQVASEFAVTDLVMAPDVEAQTPEPAAAAATEPGPARTTRPPRRRAGRPAGAAVPAAEAPVVEVPASPAPPADADSPSAENGSAVNGTAANGGAADSGAGNGSAPHGTPEQASSGEISSGAGDAGGNGTPETPRKPAAPRRRRAASRPAGPAGAPVPQ